VSVSIAPNGWQLTEVGDYEAQNLNIKRMLNRSTTVHPALNSQFWLGAVMCRFSSQILIKMTEQEFYRKTDECIARFKNGKERYRNSATFNRVVQMLVRDADPYEIIDHLCQMSDDQNKAFEQYIHRDTRPMVMS
jgi:hypothetical protein